MSRTKTCLLTSVALIAISATGAYAQDKSSSSGEGTAVEEVVVTGSRIRQSTDTSTPAPVSVVSPTAIADRGFTNVGQALGELPSMRPRTATGTPGLTGQGATGAEYPNLFNLGAGRTLTLINGRRTVATSGGLGDDAVDANIIPLGLIKRVDVVQGGGAVVYGSGAIAGVVNYVLNDHFNGLQIDGQLSQTTRWDYPTTAFRLTGGTDFRDGKGNIALDLEYSRTGFIRKYQRPETDATSFAAPNAVPGAGTNGIPAQTYVSHFFAPGFSVNGTVVANNALFGIPSLLLVNGQTVRFSDDGLSLVPFNPGTTIPALPYGVNGGDYNNREEDAGAGAVVPRISRHIANLVGHYDISNNLKISTELTYAKVDGETPGAQRFLTSWVNFLSIIPAFRPLNFTKNNAFLTPTEVAQLSAASPSFASGGTLTVGKGNWYALYPDNDGSVKQDTTTYRALVGLDGKFKTWNRDFEWSASFEHAEAHFDIGAMYPNDPNLRKAIDAVRNSSGQIVCAVNADADPTNDDRGCVPLDPFGRVPISAAAKNYVLVPSGAGNGVTTSPSVNKQDDALVTLAGDVFTLPTGPVQFSASYEHREESQSFTPLVGDQLGLTFSLIPVLPASGRYTTDEFAGELQIPIIGKDFTLPLVQELSLSGSYRTVDHSLAGKADVYGGGLRWKVVDSLTLRASYSRNFRAPNLGQILLPATTLNGAVTNPCGTDQIGLGPAPANRAANCLALFQANPTFGTGPGLGVTQTTPAGSPASVRLANFIRTTIAGVAVTTRGNPNLTNEFANTTTFGFVFQPKFIPGLLITADRIDVDLSDAIVPFTPTQFAQGCMDAATPPSDLCGTLTYDSSGQIVSGVNTAVNAGAYRLRADTAVVNYNFPLTRVLSMQNPGALNFGLQVTHNRFQSSTVAGTQTRTDDTQVLPEYVGKFDLGYTRGPLRLNYSAFYLDKVKLSFTATRLNSPDFREYIASNTRQNVSVTYDFGKYRLRAGVNNLGNIHPSYPTSTYGDLIGRTVFVGAQANF